MRLPDAAYANQADGTGSARHRAPADGRVIGARATSPCAPSTAASRSAGRG
jgi:hypothetical protein